MPVKPFAEALEELIDTYVDQGAEKDEIVSDLKLKVEALEAEINDTSDD